MSEHWVERNLAGQVQPQPSMIVLHTSGSGHDVQSSVVEASCPQAGVDGVNARIEEHRRMIDGGPHTEWKTQNQTKAVEWKPRCF